MTPHCEWCPFPGCDSCAYKGGETVTAQQDSGAPSLYAEGASNEAAPAGYRGLTQSGTSGRGWASC